MAKMSDYYEESRGNVARRSSRKPRQSTADLAARYSDHETGTLLRPAGFKPEQEETIAANLERQPRHGYVATGEYENHDFDYAAAYTAPVRSTRSYRRNAR